MVGASAEGRRMRFAAKNRPNGKGIGATDDGDGVMTHKEAGGYDFGQRIKRRRAAA